MADTPKLIYTGGGADEIKITQTTFPGIKIPPLEGINLTVPYLATIHFVVECKVSAGRELKARISRTNPGPYPMLNSEVILTTSAKYGMYSHMSGFRLDPGNHEIYMECCVSGGVGYVRYRYFSVTLSTI